MTIRRWTMLGVVALVGCGPMGPEPMDAGASDAGLTPGRTDGGATMDAGLTMDAGARVDAGVSSDAGQPTDAGLTASDGGVRFSVDVAPVLQVCTGCHSDRATYAGVQNLVTPGDPSASVLYLRITSDSRPMPPFGALSMTNPQGAARIEAWIRAGARDD
ncbi:MAG: hypothetical protein SFW67_24085 [Myxococcaceae bacterium]|nr:hypothetical protein [Myxococcaceae bacterium]